jgi:glycosyltransferase involved in cell wall biosynthesis
MRFHIATNRVHDFEAIRRDAEAGECPRFFLGTLLQRLEGTAHQPGGHRITPLDRLRAKVVGRPEHWALARALAGRRLGPDDVIYCPGEDIGFPVAALCGGRRGGPRVAVFVHNADRPRARAALRLFRLRGRIDLFVAIARHQTDFVRDYLRLPESSTLLIPDQTDLRFFTPGPAGAGKARPIVASVGLEQRDYRTLAAATADLDVDVRISGFSEAAAVQSRAFPETLPANMMRRFYSWPELVQLYRDADVVAVSLFPCRYSAGITTLMEAMSCDRPVVATWTEGLADYLSSPGAVSVTPSGDPAALRRAIVELLEDRPRAEELARNGHAMARQRFDSDRLLEELARRFAGLVPGRVAPRRDAPSAPEASPIS